MQQLSSYYQENQAIFTDVIVIGAGASGLFCAITAGKRGRKVLIFDHANKAGKKILMSGGGRCNFTNYDIEASHYISENPHFCKSALSRFSNWNFISLVSQHNIPYHEKAHGQLFCDNSSQDILQMLLTECSNVGVKIHLKSQIHQITPLTNKTGFTLQISQNNQIKTYICQSLVIATGGLSIPTMGATGFGYQVAKQFGHTIIPTNAGLVPFILTDKLGDFIKSLAGISLEVIAFNEKVSFKLPLLFTHRGLSGPAMLQLSNYWQTGEPIFINLLPEIDATEFLIQHKQQNPKITLKVLLNHYLPCEPLPKKVLSVLQTLFWQDIATMSLSNITDERLQQIGHQLNHWQIIPAGTEGYRTAEVTKGGIATDKISSKTMESQLQPHLYFVGEVLDVTGWLGGYNFQWAWASGFVAGEVV